MLQDVNPYLLGCAVRPLVNGGHVFIFPLINYLYLILLIRYNMGSSKKEKAPPSPPPPLAFPARAACLAPAPAYAAIAACLAPASAYASRLGGGGGLGGAFG